MDKTTITVTTETTETTETTTTKLPPVFLGEFPAALNGPTSILLFSQEKFQEMDGKKNSSGYPIAEDYGRKLAQICYYKINKSIMDGFFKEYRRLAPHRF